MNRPALATRPDVHLPSHTDATDGPPRPAARPRLDLGVPLGLFLLSVIPAIGGGLRLASYLPGNALLPDEDRFAGTRWLLLVHVVGVLMFALVGAFQFSRVIRGTVAGAHRWMGRAAGVGGLLASVAGTVGLFAFGPHPQGSPLLTVVRVAAGSAATVWLVLGFRAAFRRDYAAHGRWMSRAYAVGAAAGGTQALFLIPITAAQGPTSTGFAVGMVLGFGVNLAVVEWALRRGRTA